MLTRSNLCFEVPSAYLLPQHVACVIPHTSYCISHVGIVLCPFGLSPLSVPTAVGDNGEEVLYGTQNGRVGLVQVGPEEPLYRWDLDNDKREGGEGEGREGVRGKEGREGGREDSEGVRE